MKEPINYCTNGINWPCLTWEQWATFWQAFGAIGSLAVAGAAVFIAWHFPSRQHALDKEKSEISGVLAAVRTLQQIGVALKPMLEVDPSDGIAWRDRFHDVAKAIHAAFPQQMDTQIYGPLQGAMASTIPIFMQIANVEISNEGAEKMPLELKLELIEGMRKLKAKGEDMTDKGIQLLSRYSN